MSREYSYPVTKFFGLGGAGGLIEMTYAELKDLKQQNALTEGQLYLLTDYQTKYLMPFITPQLIYTVTEIEPLILISVSSNLFSPIAHSNKYPNDIIYYSFDDNNCGDTNNTPRNGFIQRRIDTVNNIDVPLDWRNMVFPVFKATAAAWSSGSVTANNFYQIGNNIYRALRTATPTSENDDTTLLLICNINDYTFSGLTNFSQLSIDKSDYALRYTFNQNASLTEKNPAKMTGAVNPKNILILSESDSGIQGNIFLFDSKFNMPFNITIGNGSYANIFIKSSGNITLGAGCHSNIFKDSLGHIKIGDSCNNNIIGGVYHEISNNCIKNIITNGYNKLAQNIENVNILGYRNIIEIACNNISIINSQSQNNYIGQNSRNIYASAIFTNNKIGVDTRNIILNYSFYNSSIGDSCDNIEIKNSSMSLILGNNCYNFDIMVANLSNVSFEAGCTISASGSFILSNCDFGSNCGINITGAANQSFNNIKTANSLSFNITSTLMTSINSITASKEIFVDQSGNNKLRYLTATNVWTYLAL